MVVKNLVKPSEGLARYRMPEAFATHADALEYAVRAISERRRACGFSLARKYILFVPDKYTLRAERLLYADNAGAFDSEVLTFNRLCYRVQEHAGVALPQKPLSRLGAILTVRRILSENADRLVCFRRSALSAGFGETVYDNLCQLAASGLTAADLPEDMEGVTGKKLRDLKTVYAAYEQAVRNRYVDASGRLLLLLETLEKDASYFADTDVYFACYDRFTPLQRRVAGKICAVCGEGRAHIAYPACKLDLSGKEIEEYAAPTRADELKAAAARIRALHDGRGVAYDDIGVVAAKPYTARLKRIFAEYGIPYFADEKYALSSHPLARYVLDLFSVALSGSNENYIRLSKSPYCGVAPADADAFENYVRGTALPEWGAAHAFTYEPSDPAVAGTLPAAERVRARLTALTRGVRKEEIRNGEDFCRAVLAALPSDEAEITAEGKGIFPRAADEIAAQAGVLAEVFPQKTSFALLLDALKESFSCKEVGVIPNRAGTVEAGEMSVFRASRKKYLFVLGMHEGEIPAVLQDDGLLSDRDIERAAAYGDGSVRIEPRIDERNARAEEEACSVLSASGALFLSYCESETPSPLLDRIARAYPVTPVSYEQERLDLAGIDGNGNRTARGRDGALLLRLCPTPASALELYLAGASASAAGGEGSGFESELAAALGGRIPVTAARGAIAAQAGELYTARSISVSRVQEYFSCPFRCFLRYGLRLRPRPDGSVSPLDLGTFLHRVIELFVARGERDFPEKTVPALVAEVLAEQPRLLKGASDGFIAEITAEAVTLARVVADQIRKGGFTECRTEVPFGGEGASLAGGEIRLPHGAATVEGVIDRLDVAENGGRGAARVIDYKTGYAAFSYADIYYGKKLQLPVYLAVARENGYAPAGMFYFPFSSGFSDENDHRLLGVFDTAYAREMDRALATPSHASDVVRARSTKDSSPDKVTLVRSGNAAVTGDTLAAVCDYARAALDAGAKEMFGGYIAAAPLSGGNVSECAYCEMRAACTASGGIERERKKGSVSADDFVRIRSEL